MCEGAPEVRTLVRLAFHDCASARCDGCIDVTQAGNAGLGGMVTALVPLCAKYADVMSTADCWQTAGAMAVEETSKNSADPLKLPLYFGRTDSTCTGFSQANVEASFPSGRRGMLFPSLACSQCFASAETELMRGFCIAPAKPLMSWREQRKRAVIATGCKHCGCSFQGWSRQHSTSGSILDSPKPRQ